MNAIERVIKKWRSDAKKMWNNGHNGEACGTTDCADRLERQEQRADALIQLALRMMDAYHMSGEIGIADIPTVASVREAAKEEGGA